MKMLAINKRKKNIVKHKVIIKHLFVLCSAFVLSACGQKGALYLQDSTSEQNTTTAKTKANLSWNQTQAKQTVDKDQSIKGMPESENY